MYCNGFLVVTIFFIYFLKSHGQLCFYTYVEFQSVNSLTPGRVEHPGPSLEAVSDIFCVSHLSAVSSPSAVHSAVHTFLSLLVFVYLGASICAAVRDGSGEPVPASCLAEAGSLTSAACSRLASLLASGAAPIPASHLTVGTLGLQCRCRSPHPASYTSFSEPARRQAWEAERSNSLSHLPSPDVLGFYSYCKHFYNI